MNVVAVSSDRRLHGLCSDILSGLLGRDWKLTAADSRDNLPEADLYLWDSTPDTRFPDDINSTNHIVLVSRSNLVALREKLELTDASILLKPVTRATLQTFLEQACDRWRNSRQVSVGDLKSDRDELLQCLIEANLKLQEYDQQRTNFLARAVHDFRTPLTAVSGYCGLLLSGQLGALSQDQEEVIRRMLGSAKRLSRMASAMFELSICHRVNTAPDLKLQDIEDCISQAVYETSGAVQDKKIQVTVEVEAPQSPLAFERSKIEQVLVNLLENAAKFTPRQGWIKISGYPFRWESAPNSCVAIDRPREDRRENAAEEPNSYRIDIADSGPGIPEKQLDGIFEEYTSYRGGADRSGAGLGLAICRMIVNAHKGRLWAESSGSGARFSFVLPLGQPEHPEEDEETRQEEFCQTSAI